MRRGVVFSLLAAAMLAGCAQPPPPPPSTMAQYEQLQRTNPQAYSQYVVINHNLQRVLDPEVKPAQRVDSLQVVTALAGDDVEIRKKLAALMSDPKTPQEVQAAILTFLLRKDYPDMAAYVVQAMPNLTRFPSLHDAVLEWLTKHPTPAVLAEVVKLWAQESSVSGPNEPRFRQIVERIAGKPWNDALLDGLNTPGFTATSAAVSVLARRSQPTALRQLLLGLTPRTEDMTAIQTFLVKFDYLPTTDVEYTAIAQIYRTQRDTIDDAARLAGTWRDDFGYHFNARDFHLLSRLARDPLRTGLRRAQLIAELGQAFNARSHLHYKTPAGLPAIEDRFWLRADALSMADLWNLYLLSDLLSRPRTEMAVRILAEGDRKDTRHAWGGLVFYKAGQAEATQYWPDPQEPPDDLTYAPGAKYRWGTGERDFYADQRDSLCRFICHFEKAENGDRAGPTAAELRDARENNYNGVIFTSIDANQFCAHYYNPDGTVISLGVFPLRK
ncbi:MAG: hypothetical protein ACE15C_20445 [Phycisphaerae bacterium]